MDRSDGTGQVLRGKALRVCRDRLEADEARTALCVPAEREGVVFERAALEEILQQTVGCPYFLQEWGRHAWNTADRSPISRRDAARATLLALVELDVGFFRVRFDRLTPSKKALSARPQQLDYRRRSHPGEHPCHSQDAGQSPRSEAQVKLLDPFVPVLRSADREINCACRTTPAPQRP